MGNYVTIHCLECVWIPRNYQVSGNKEFKWEEVVKEALIVANLANLHTANLKSNDLRYCFGFAEFVVCS